MKNNKTISKEGAIVIAALIFAITIPQIIWLINKFNITKEELPSPNIILYDSEYVEIDTDIINSIKSYMTENYSDYDLISIHIDHIDNLISTTVSIASKEYIDNIYNYTYIKVRKYDYTDLVFYNIPDIENWYHIVNEFKSVSKDISKNIGISVDIFNLSIVNGNDYETVWFTINGEGEVEYDIIKEYFENRYK